MVEEDLEELERAIATLGALSGRDSQRLIVEVRRLRAVVAGLEAALSEIGGCAAQTLAARGVTGWDEGEDGLLSIKDTVDTALGLSPASVPSAAPGTRT